MRRKTQRDSMRTLRNLLVLSALMLVVAWTLLGHGGPMVWGFGFGITFNPFNQDWGLLQTYGKVAIMVAFMLIATSIYRANRCPHCLKKFIAFREEPLCNCDDINASDQQGDASAPATDANPASRPPSP